MAFGSIGSFVGASNKTSGDPFTFNPLGQLNANDIGILVVAKDNSSTTNNSDNNEIVGVTDTVGNTWSEVKEITSTDGAAEDGTTVGVYYTKATTSLATAQTITADFVSAITAKAISGWKFSVGAGNTVSIVGIWTRVEPDDTDFGSIIASGLPSQEYLFFRGDAGETGGGLGYTSTLGYTPLLNASTAGAGVRTNQFASGEFKIFNGTGETSDPLAAIVAGNKASAFIVFKEVAPTVGTVQPLLTLVGVGT